MIRINEKLTVLHDNNSSFSDFSPEMVDFDRGTASFTFVTAEDSIYVGFYKPINTFFVQMGTANTNAAAMTIKFHNGTIFTNVSGVFDDSVALNRSGFVRWDRNQIDEVVTTINSVEQFWYKLNLSVDSSAMVLNGLNIVFSDDQDLKRVLPEQDKYFSSGETSHILTHMAARNEIIQSLNLLGKEKINSDGVVEDVSSFDLLEVSEVNLASTYLVLSMIMMNLSDELDDIYMQKQEKYQSKYDKIINSITLRIDADDDGIDDEIEREDQNFGFIRRV